VVRDPHARAAAVLGVAEAAASLGWWTVGVMPSPIRGGSGNKEFLLWLRRSDSDPSVPDLTGAVQQDGIVLFTDPAGSPG
jgi:23S rRNA (cytidine1920-2'-O)/16S rRNA (cytidine1409-2'-O)-methyltransferase